MALRTQHLRFLSTTYCRARHSSSVRGGLYLAQELVISSSAALVIPSQLFRTPGHDSRCGLLNNARPFSSSSSSEDTTNKTPNVEKEDPNDDEPSLLYEAPFASLTLRLKRISLMSAVVGILGLPALSIFCPGSVPASGQLAVIATAGLTAVGSTALLSYCFSPYVHTLERLPASATKNIYSDGEDATTTNDALNGNKDIFRITTRDILARRVETVFDPATDVSPAPKSNARPFCNFMVKGLPMYVHPELIDDYSVRVQLVGEDPQQDDSEARNKKWKDDDEFL